MTERSTSRPAGEARHPYDLTGLAAAAYYRVSHDGSGEEKSVRDQRAEAHRWAEREGVSLVIEPEDVSVSASEFAQNKRHYRRPGFERLRAAIEAGRV